MSFYESTLDYFNACNIALSERFVPYFTISTCCHLINLENQKREFALDGGRVANFRMHVFFVAPPGFMKSLMLMKFLDGPYSVLGGTDVGTGFEGAMTEAGYVGTIKAVDGEAAVVYGAAYDHQENILGIDEFAQLTNSMKMEHSINLDTAMLTSLDSGYLNKRLAMGKIRYVTQLTLWSGSQPSRFDLSSGLGRRLMFLFFIPTREEEALIRSARRAGKNKRQPVEKLEVIRKDVAEIMIKLKSVTKIVYDKSLYDCLDEMGIPHYEEELYERMALGYTIATGNFTDVVNITVDPRLKALITRCNGWRNEIKRGSEYSQIISVIKEMHNMTMTEVKKRLANMGWTWVKSSEIMNALQRQGIITVMKDKSQGKGRPKEIIIVNE